MFRIKFDAFFNICLFVAFSFCCLFIKNGSATTFNAEKCDVVSNSYDSAIGSYVNFVKFRTDTKKYVEAQAQNCQASNYIDICVQSDVRLNFPTIAASYKSKLAQYLLNLSNDISGKQWPSKLAEKLENLKTKLVSNEEGSSFTDEISKLTSKMQEIANLKENFQNFEKKISNLFIRTPEYDYNIANVDAGESNNNSVFENSPCFGSFFQDTSATGITYKFEESATKTFAGENILVNDQNGNLRAAIIHTHLHIKNISSYLSAYNEIKLKPLFEEASGNLLYLDNHFITIKNKADEVIDEIVGLHEILEDIKAAHKELINYSLILNKIAIDVNSTAQADYFETVIKEFEARDASINQALDKINTAYESLLYTRNNIDTDISDIKNILENLANYLAAQFSEANIQSFFASHGLQEADDSVYDFYIKKIDELLLDESLSVTNLGELSSSQAIEFEQLVHLAEITKSSTTSIADNEQYASYLYSKLLRNFFRKIIGTTRYNNLMNDYFEYMVNNQSKHADYGHKYNLAENTTPIACLDKGFDYEYYNSLLGGKDFDRSFPTSELSFFETDLPGGIVTALGIVNNIPDNLKTISENIITHVNNLDDISVINAENAVNNFLLLIANNADFIHELNTNIDDFVAANQNLKPCNEFRLFADDKVRPFDNSKNPGTIFDINSSYENYSFQKVIYKTIITEAGDICVQYLHPGHDPYLIDCKPFEGVRGVDEQYMACNMAKSCYDQSEVGSKSLFSVSSVAAQCLLDTLDNILVRDGRVDNCDANILPHAELTISPFWKFQNSMQNIIYSLLVLYLILMGFRIVMSTGEYSYTEALLGVIKILIVMYLAVGPRFGPIDINNNSNDSGIVTKLLPFFKQAIHEFAMFVFDATSAEGLCNFSDSEVVGEYPEGREYLRLWDALDCRLSYYIGASGWHNIECVVNGNVGKCIIGLVRFISLAILGLSIPFIIFMIAFGFFVLSLFFNFITTFLICLIGIYILLYFGPVFIPLLLFEQTRGYFTGWLRLLVSFTLQPMVIGAMMAILFVMFDAVYFGDCKFKAVEHNDRYYFELINPALYSATGEDLDTGIEVVDTTSNYANNTYGYLKTQYNVLSDAIFPRSSCVSSIGYLVHNVTNGSGIASISALLFKIQFWRPANYQAVIEMLKLVIFCYVFYYFSTLINRFASQLTSGLDLTKFAAGATSIIDRVKLPSKGKAGRGKPAGGGDKASTGGGGGDKASTGSSSGGDKASTGG